MEERIPTRRELLAELEELRARAAGLAEADARRRSVEEQLRREKELSESLIRSSPNGILAMDLEWRYTLWNPAMERISGFEADRCLGKVAWEVFPFLKEGELMSYMEAARSGHSVVCRNQRYVEPGTGREVYFDAYYSPLRGPGSETVGVLGIVPDVTERRRSEEALREARHLLEKRVAERTAALTREIADRERAEAELRREKEFSESLIHSSVDGILAFDRRRRYTVWNPAMERLTSVPREEALGKDMFELFPFLKEIGVEEAVQAALDGQESTLRDSPYKTPRTGAEGFFEAHYSPIRDVAGKIVGGLGIVRDITERKQLEAERLRTSKLRSLSLLAGGLAHDFNNLLTGILGHVAVAVRMVTPESKVQRKLKAAETSCVRASQLAEELLTFAKGGIPVKETVFLAETIRESAEFAVRGANVRCELEIAPDLAPAEVDLGQISQVINNLVINACQAMPEGGTIRVEAANVTLEPGDPRPLEAGPYVRVSIADQGVGMPAEMLEKIFDPYFTTKQRNTGLGLATAHSIIDHHDGCIAVESEVGAGTTFHVYLPSSDAVVEKTVPEAPEPVADARVLVMDDDPVIRDVVGEFLDDGGFRTTLVADGEDAVRRFREARDAGEPFDVVVLDLTIRGGVGGAETLERLREIDPKIKALVASGYSNDPVLAEFRRYGFNARIPKPFLPDTLSEALQKVLAE